MLTKKKMRGKYIIPLLYIFLFIEPIGDVIQPFKYFDELFAIVAIPIFLYKSRLKIKKRKPGIGFYVIVFLFLGMLGDIFYQYQPLFVWLSDVLINAKFWLVLYIGYVVSEKIEYSRMKKKLMLHVKIVTLIFASLFIIDNIIGIFTPIIRYGFRSTHLIYFHPTYFAAYCVLLISIFLSVHTPRKDMWVFIILLLLLSSTLRSKAVAASLLFMISYYLIYIRKKKITWKTLLLFLPVGIAIAWDQIEWYFFSSIKLDSARYMLLLTAFLIAKECFPIGSGFGTFASHLSGEYYSPLYSIYGLSNVNGLKENNYGFMSDSFWPMIIAQNGYIGTIFYLIVIYKLYEFIVSVRLKNLNYYSASMTAFIYLLIVSFAESSFVHPMMIPLAFWIGLLCGQMNTKESYKNEISIK